MNLDLLLFTSLLKSSTSHFTWWLTPHTSCHDLQSITLRFSSIRQWHTHKILTRWNISLLHLSPCLETVCSKKLLEPNNSFFRVCGFATGQLDEKNLSLVQTLTITLMWIHALKLTHMPTPVVSGLNSQLGDCEQGVTERSNCSKTWQKKPSSGSVSWSEVLVFGVMFQVLAWSSGCRPWIGTKPWRELLVSWSEVLVSWCEVLVPDLRFWFLCGGPGSWSEVFSLCSQCEVGTAAGCGSVLVWGRAPRPDLLLQPGLDHGGR